MTKSRESGGQAKRLGICLIVLIIAQSILAVYLGVRKDGVHIDEVYTYLLSNSYHTDRISNEPDVWNGWIDSRKLMDFVTVQKGEGFAYDKVYYNNSLDCHPPLYYWLIHTICSFFPNVYSKWFGLLLNLLSMIVSDIILWLICRKIFPDGNTAFLPLLMWAFSGLCMSTFLFIRMYMLLTAITLLYTYWTMLILEKGLTLRRSVVLYLICLSGCFTQYFFIIYAFFITAIVCVYKTAKKNLKDTLFYGVPVLLSVVSLLLLFPAVLKQSFGSETNNIGNEVSRNLFDFSGLIGAVLLNALSTLKGFFSKYSIILTAVFAVVALLCLYSGIKRNAGSPSALPKTSTLC